MAIPCIVHVKRNADGELRQYRGLEWHDDSDYPDFIWADGNYACDCNRHLFFCRAAGDEPDDRPPCGGNVYAVRVTDEQGKELYSDFD